MSLHRPDYIAPLSFLQTSGASQCCFTVRLNMPESPRWEEPPAVCCRLPGYLPSSPEVRLRLRIHHRGPPPVTHHVSRLSRRSHVRQLLLIEIPASSMHPPFLPFLHLHGINYVATLTHVLYIFCIFCTCFFQAMSTVADPIIYSIIKNSISRRNKYAVSNNSGTIEIFPLKRI